MNVVQEIKRINERELEAGIPLSASWHHKYKDSAWIYMGGLPYDLSEGDCLCVFSQVGEIEDVNLIRDRETGKSKGFGFLKFANQKSTVLAVDNFNGYTLLDRVLRVDHVLQYKLPKHLQRHEEDEEDDEDDDVTSDHEVAPRGLPGHAYEGVELANAYTVASGTDVFAPVPLDKTERKKAAKRTLKRQRHEAKDRRRVGKNARREARQAFSVEDRAEGETQSPRRTRVRVTSGPSDSGWRGAREPTTLQALPMPRQEMSQAMWDQRARERSQHFGGLSRRR